MPFPPLAERFERLEEALRICPQMWSDDDGAATSTTSASLSKVDRRTRPRIRTAFLRRAEQLAAFGVQHIHVRAPQPDPVGFVAKVSESPPPRPAAVEPVR